MIRSILIHLSSNMWSDRPGKFTEYLNFDETLWQHLVKRCAEAGLNAIFLDVGDGVAFRSHPEIVTRGAWSAAKIREEIARCRDLGIKLYPKLNFSSSHDAWLQMYSRMLSSPTYYQVCRDLIAETVELFEGPEHFHIGMDEENAYNQASYLYSVIRQEELWWHDLNFLCDTVRRNGARAWMWSDKFWSCDPEEFVRNVPKDVVQNNWFYWNEVDLPETGESGPLPDVDDYSLPQWRGRIMKTFKTLDRYGYDQVPAGSNWATPENYGLLTEFCQKNISPEHFAGMMMTVWRPTTEAERATWDAALDQTAAANRKFGLN